MRRCLLPVLISAACCLSLTGPALGVVLTQTLGTTTESATSYTPPAPASWPVRELEWFDDLQRAYGAGNATITLTAGNYYGGLGNLMDASSDTGIGGWLIVPRDDYADTTVDIKFGAGYTGSRTLYEINAFHGLNTTRDPYDFDLYYSTVADPTTFNHIVRVQSGTQNQAVAVRTVFSSSAPTDVDTVRLVSRYAPGYFYGNTFQEMDINFATHTHAMYETSTVQTAYSASASDLIDQSQSTLLNTSISGFNQDFALGGTANLNDGVTGAAYPAGASQGVLDTDGAYTATYYLNTNSAPNGYDIASVSTISAHADNRKGQKYELLFSKVGDESFVSVGTFELYYSTGTEGSSRLTLSNVVGSVLYGADGLTAASNVDAVRFNILSPTSGNSANTVYRELDVFGTVTIPEPSSSLLLSMAGLAYWLRRRMQTR